MNKAGTPTIISKTAWEDGPRRIYAVELTIYEAESNSSRYELIAFAPISRSAPDMITARYSNWGATTITEKERQEMRRMVASIELP